MDVVDGELRATTFLNFAHSTLDSFVKSRTGDVVFQFEHLQEILEQLEMIIPRYLDDPVRLDNLLQLSDRISTIMEQGNAIKQEEPDSFYEDDENEIHPSLSTPILSSASYQVEEQEDHEDKEDIECEICFETVKYSESVAFQQCLHRYCKLCASHYLTQLIKDANVENIVCPNPSCGLVIVWEEIKFLVEPDVFDKYERFSLLALLRGDESTRYCPYPDCEGISVGDSGSDSCATCPTCQRDFCYLCKVPWHNGKTCGAFEKDNELNTLDDKTKKWMQKNKVKQCPHCGMPAMRIAGCPDMICGGCKKHWNWNWDGQSDKDKEETKLEKAAFMYPRLIKGSLLNRENTEKWNRSKKEAIKDNTLEWGIISAVGIPLFVVGGGPAFAVRKYRHTKRFIRGFRENRSQSTDNV